MMFIRFSLGNYSPWSSLLGEYRPPRFLEKSRRGPLPVKAYRPRGTLDATQHPDGSSPRQQAQLGFICLFLFKNRRFREIGLCLRGQIDGFWLQREGKADGVEDFALEFIRARQVGVALSVTVCRVEIS